MREPSSWNRQRQPVGEPPGRLTAAVPGPPIGLAVGVRWKTKIQKHTRIFLCRRLSPIGLIHFGEKYWALPCQLLDHHARCPFHPRIGRSSPSISKPPTTVPIARVPWEWCGSKITASFIGKRYSSARRGRRWCSLSFTASHGRWWKVPRRLRKYGRVLHRCWMGPVRSWPIMPRLIGGFWKRVAGRPDCPFRSCRFIAPCKLPGSGGAFTRMICLRSAGD